MERITPGADLDHLSAASAQVGNGVLTEELADATAPVRRSDGKKVDRAVARSAFESPRDEASDGVVGEACDDGVSTGLGSVEGWEFVLVITLPVTVLVLEDPFAKEGPGVLLEEGGEGLDEEIEHNLVIVRRQRSDVHGAAFRLRNRARSEAGCRWHPPSVGERFLSDDARQRDKTRNDRHTLLSPGQQRSVPATPALNAGQPFGRAGLSWT